MCYYMVRSISSMARGTDKFQEFMGEVRGDLKSGAAAAAQRKQSGEKPYPWAKDYNDGKEPAPKPPKKNVRTKDNTGKTTTTPPVVKPK